MTEAEKAYKAAERVIAEAIEQQAKDGKRAFLELSGMDFRHLERLPNRIRSLEIDSINLDGTRIGDSQTEILSHITGLNRLSLNGTTISDFGAIRLATFSSLRRLYIGGTDITDIGALALAALPSLGYLNVCNTLVYDLRPFRKLPAIAGDGLFGGLDFLDTTATREEPRLAEISEMLGAVARMAALNAFLETWVPKPRKSGASLPVPAPEMALTTPRHVTEQKIKYLIRNAPASGMVASQLAAQLTAALNDLPIVDGRNEPPEDFAHYFALRDLLQQLALDMANPKHATVAARIAQLESTVEKLGAALAAEIKRADSAELKLANDGIVGSFKKRVGARLADLTILGTGTAAILTATFYLGEAHPVTKALIAAISGAAK